MLFVKVINMQTRKTSQNLPHEEWRLW